DGCVLDSMLCYCRTGNKSHSTDCVGNRFVPVDSVSSVCCRREHNEPVNDKRKHGFDDRSYVPASNQYGAISRMVPRIVFFTSHSVRRIHLCWTSRIWMDVCC